MFYTIYKIINTVNGKYYIGKHQTKDLNDGYMGSGKLLKAAISKYGKENFHKEILYVVQTEKEMDLLEKILVVPDIEINYNLCEGGQGGWGYLNKNFWNEEKRTEHNRKVSLFGTKEFINKHRNVFADNGRRRRGCKLSEEHKKNISVAQAGKTRPEFSQQWKENISKGQLGKKRGPYKKKQTLS